MITNASHDITCLLSVVFNLLEVQKVEIDMEKQKVYVTSSLSGDDILATIKKTGRECSYVGVKQ